MPPLHEEPIVGTDSALDDALADGGVRATDSDSRTPAGVQTHPAKRVARRTQVIAFAGVAGVFLTAFLFLKPVDSPLPDEAYVAMAKDTPQGRLYFTNHVAPCRVTRVFTVQVNCDYVAAAGVPTEKFRVHIDPRRNVIIEVEASFNP